MGWTGSLAAGFGGFAGGAGGGTGVGAGVGARLSTVRVGCGRGAFRAASKMVPHIPQNRKLLELTSPHFGQITGLLPAGWPLLRV